jgi:hypothetical protein
LSFVSPYYDVVLAYRCNTISIITTVFGLALGFLFDLLIWLLASRLIWLEFQWDSYAST